MLRDKMETFHVDPPASVWSAISSRLGGRSRRSMVIIALAAAASVALAVTLGITYFGTGLPEQDTLAESGVLPGEEANGQREQQVAETGDRTREGRNEGEERSTLEEKVASVVDEVLDKESVQTDSYRTPAVTEVLKHGERLAASAEGEPQRMETTHALSPEQETTHALSPEQETTQALSPEQDSPKEEGPVEEDASMQEVSEQELPDAGEAGMLDPGDLPSGDSRWVLGASVSPLYSYRDAEAQVLAGTQEHESGMLSYSGGIQVGYHTGGRLAFETGIYFNKMGIDIGSPGIQQFSAVYDFAPLDAGSGRSNILAISNTVGNIVSRSGDIYVNNYKLNASEEAAALNNDFGESVNADQGIRQHLDYLEIPFNLRYTVVDRSIEIQLIGGLSTNFLVNNYVSMDTGDGNVELGYLANVRNVNYSGNAGVGLVYHMLDQLSLSVEPRFRYFLNSVNDDTLPSTHPYTIGLYTGLRYIF